MLGKSVIISKIRFLKTCEKEKSEYSNLICSILWWCVEKNVSKEAAIGFNGRQVLDLQVKYAAYVFRK